MIAVIRRQANASAALALAFALVIYFGWRSGLNLHRVLPLASLRAFGLAHQVPGWVKHSLPDALWQYAFTAIVAGLWRDRPWDRRKIFFVGVPALAGVMIEVLQWLHLFEGTFDPMDVALSLVASAIALVVTAGSAASSR